MGDAGPIAARHSDALLVPLERFGKSSPHPRVQNLKAYEKLYKKSIEQPDQFWAEQARSLITWERDFGDLVHEGSFKDGDNAWFPEGRLNASFNCIDRHAKRKPNATAIIFEPDEPSSPNRSLTWKELQRDVSRLSWVLTRDFGVKKGDTVAIYMPMVPEAFVAVLACTRIGAIHSVVFGGFSANALRDRILDADARVVLTANEGARGGKVIALKSIVDEALSQCPNVASCLVYRATMSAVPMQAGRDFDWTRETQKWPAVFTPVSMSSEDPLFMLYTSGSTGKPKGLMHTTAGYLLGAALSTQYVFDIHADDGDVFFCGADIGWITGHSYSLYGPLMLGCNVVIYEGTPVYPSPSRYWEIIEKHSVTQLYSAPTVLRLLKRAGDQYVKSDAVQSSLRVVGSVGEPLAANVWQWVHDVVGRGQIHVVDTFFQTETGSYLIAPLAGTTPSKPGCCTLPFFGVEPALLNPATGVEIATPGIEGVLTIKRPIPSMSRTVWRDHNRFMNVYYNPYPGYYFTGDGAIRDQDGYFWIQGRVDDVINVAAHRLSTAEIEAALLEHAYMAEVAVVGVPDDLTGQAVTAFVSLNRSIDNAEAVRIAKEQVSTSIGKFASPKHVVVVQDLPKNRAGKIMRRLLRKIWCGEEDQLGDITTLVNPAAIPAIISAVNPGRAPQTPEPTEIDQLQNLARRMSIC
ncbi:Acetyl-coenzyme A synthetase [Cercospora beticola]|uniref:Acetyl-coenzyme A synthetase n=1 Tax=Cercospora beticola TaxID=122368 RepID=A0A2G5HQJ5_CERBT|nr:Acetyl-coenzyme A synthetase [Cercospora beticola]PIA94817.1 Acetyl-coenzyme A synthetase [Cercospora beticola]WPB04996.1 Acetyl-coenzyme A synthetase [Cercospora beticola]